MTPKMQAELDMCLQTQLPVLLACIDTMISTDLRDDVRRIAVPTLVIHGDADESAPLPITGRATAALLRNGRIEVYPGAPHGLYITEENRLNKYLLEFIHGLGK